MFRVVVLFALVPLVSAFNLRRILNETEKIVGGVEDAIADVGHSFVDAFRPHPVLKLRSSCTGFTFAASYYGDPYVHGCRLDELNVTVEDVPGAVCAPDCTFSDCPPVPKGLHAVPTCDIMDGSTGHYYCGMVCGNSTECPQNASCKAIQGTGLCTYNLVH